MMRHGKKLVILAAAAAVLIALAPGATAQDAAPVKDTRPGKAITFYGHVFGTGLNAPMPFNTQFPIGEENYGLGTYSICTPAGNAFGLPPTPSEGTNCDDDPNPKLVFFSSPGFVDVTNSAQFNAGGGWGLFHNERGQTKDIYLDPAGNVEVTTYMALDFHAWSVGGGETNCPAAHPRDVGCPYPYWGWDPGAYPDWTVSATLYSAKLGEHGANASEAPPVAEAIASGAYEIIAEGTTAPTLVQNGVPGAPNALEFKVNLGPPKVDRIPKENSFFLVISWNANTGGTEYSTFHWRIWSGEYYPHRFTLPVRNAFDIESLATKFVFGKLLISGTINTPWGSYDINEAATKITIKDKNGAPVNAQSIEVFTDVSVAHGGHYAPAVSNYIWDYKLDKMNPGEYSVTLHAENWQGSAIAECTVKFVIGATDADSVANTAQCGAATENLGSGGNDPNAGKEPERPTGSADDRSTGVPAVPGARLATLTASTAAPAGLADAAVMGVALLGAALLATRRWFA